MANFRYTLAAIFLVVFTFFLFDVKGVLEIVQPLPGHKVAIEGEQVRVTCVARDYENVTTPVNITFYKVKNRFGDLSGPISDEGPKGNYTFERKTEENDMKLFVTLVINNMSVLLKDGYKCTAQGGGETVTYGFGISYIPRKDVPQLTEVSHNVITDFGKPVTLTCNLTIPSQQSRLVKLDKNAWYKNDMLRDEVTHLQDERLKDIKLTMENPEDAGTYTCRLFMTLQSIRKYIINSTINVQIRPKFMAKELDDNEVIRKKGESVRFPCDAQGNPIKVIWKKILKSGVVTTLNSTASSQNDSDSHYRFSNDEGRLKGFWLEIPKTNYSDRGDYKCCIPAAPNSSEQCQTFTLRVKDPLGYLWPLIGIIIEAIVIILILVIAAKLKSNSSGSTSRTVKQTELSYKITDEGGKGNIRLRNTGTRTT